jgi:hypothetical protein
MGKLRRPSRPRSMTKTPKRPLTAKDLGLTDDVCLSSHYNNTPECFRTVTDRVLGYYVAGGGPAPVRIAPIYQADTWLRYSDQPHQMISSYEVGPYLNEVGLEGEEPDADGNALALIAADALRALEHHSALCAAAAPSRKR